MIKSGSQVTMAFQLKDEDGHVWDESTREQPFTFTQGDHQIMKVLEQALEGKSSGDHVKVTLLPEQGYGDHDPNLIRPLPREHFAEVENLQVGMVFQPTDDPNLILTIVEVGETTVTVDGNHPLAGKNLVFDIDVLNVEDPN